MGGCVQAFNKSNIHKSNSIKYTSTFSKTVRGRIIQIFHSSLLKYYEGMVINFSTFFFPLYFY